MPDIVAPDSHVLFIEEDHALSPDFYRVLQAMVELKEHIQDPQVWGVSLNR